MLDVRVVVFLNEGEEVGEEVGEDEDEGKRGEDEEEDEEDDEDEEIGQVETPANVFLESIKPHIPAITGLLLTKFGLIPQQQVEGINGIADNETDIDMIINELESVDANIITRLKKLVYLAKNDKNTYNLAVNFLNNLVPDSKV